MARSVTVREFRRILEDGTEAEKDALCIRITSASNDELATTLLHETSGVSRDQKTALQVAVNCDNFRFFRLLLEKGANHKSRNKSGGTALTEAALHSTDILCYMLHELECVDIINTKNEYGMTALMFAIRKAPAAAVKLMLDRGADPTMHSNLHTIYGWDFTPLICAAYHGAIESAKLLLEYGANLHGTTHCRVNAMHCAAECGHAPFVKWLLDIGDGHDMMVSQNNKGQTPLDLAIDHQYECEAGASQGVIDLLLQAYKDIIVTQEGNLCLHWILRTAECNMILPVGRLPMEERLALLALFVSQQANQISTADSTGALSLHIACQNRDTPIDVLQFLVEQDPTTVRRRDNQGNLPIHTLCASNPLLDSVMYLLPESGVETFHATNRQGHTPLMVALLTSAPHDVLFYLVLHAHPDVLVAESPPLFVK